MLATKIKDTSIFYIYYFTENIFFRFSSGAQWGRFLVNCVIGWILPGETIFLTSTLLLTSGYAIGSRVCVSEGARKME